MCFLQVCFFHILLWFTTSLFPLLPRLSCFIEPCRPKHTAQPISCDSTNCLLLLSLYIIFLSKSCVLIVFCFLLFTRREHTTDNGHPRLGLSSSRISINPQNSHRPRTYYMNISSPLHYACHVVDRSF